MTRKVSLFLALAFKGAPFTITKPALLLQSADDLQKGTLPDTVVPDDANHIVPGGAKRHVFQYTAFSVKIKGDMLQPEKGIGRSSAWTESFT